MTPSCYLVAGEASGDALGAGLMAALKARVPNIRFQGVGGEKMEAEGLGSLFPYHEISLMGFAEIVPHLMSVLARISLTAEDILAKRPDLVITIDSPGFNFRLIKRLRKAGLQSKFVHYVAPSVWAYKPERAKKCAALLDHLLCLLPFEPPYFEKEGLKAAFVGHPVAYQPKGDGQAFRAKYELAADQPLIAVFPGSREAEIRRHLPVFAPALVKLSECRSNLALAVPVARRLLPLLAHYFKSCPLRAVVVSDEEDKRNAIAAANTALVKSGTVSLEVAEGGAPQVVAYRTNPLSAWMARRWLRIPHVNLINILAGEEVIPELLQEDCTPENLSQALARLLDDEEAREAQLAAASAQLEKLRLPGGVHPGEAAAEAVLETLG